MKYIFIDINYRLTRYFVTFRKAQQTLLRLNTFFPSNMEDKRLQEHLYRRKVKGEVCIWANGPTRPKLIPVSVAWSDYIVGIFLLSPGWDASPLQGYPTVTLAVWVERGTVRGKCLAQEHNAMTQPGLGLGPLDPEWTTITAGSWLSNNNLQLVQTYFCMRGELIFIW